MYQVYKESFLSNQKFLTPSCGGYYTLHPSVDFRLPMDRTLRRHVKREIERCATALEPETLAQYASIVTELSQCGTRRILEQDRIRTEAE